MDSSRMKRIFWLALPIIGGMISQNVLNLVDTAMVGTLGNVALAAVGLGGFATFMSQALILGISTGVQAMASRRKGEGNLDIMARPLNAGLVLVLLVAPILSGVLYFLAPVFYPYLNSDPEVIAQGVPYLQVRILAIVFVGMNFSFRGYWNAVDLSRLYMMTLVVMHISNIFLNYVLIFGKWGFPMLGVTGAGIGTSVSTLIGSIFYFILGWRYARNNGFLKVLPPFSDIKKMVLISLPSGVQQLFFAAGLTALYWIVGMVGTTELAAANVLINITLVAILPGIGLGLAAATLVGQALGRKDIEDAKAWGWDVSKVGFIGLGILGVPMWLVPEMLLGVFLHDEVAMKIAIPVMRLVGITIAFESIGLVLMNALLGAGYSKVVMVVSIVLQWFIFLPIAYLVGPVWGWGLFGIWSMQAIYRGFQTFIFGWLWRKGDWASVKV